LLYRLLTGQPAYRFERNTPIEVGRVVCTTEPDLPSVAAGRRELRGDLDAIVLQALRKEADQRYSSVEALVEDIRRYQSQEPVRARAAGWAYRTSKFLRRHHKPLITAAAVLMLSIFFIFQIRSERDRALTMEQVMLGIFETADYELGLEAIINQARFYLGQLEDQPKVRAQLMATLGWIYRSLGRYDEALEVMEQGLAVRRALYGNDHLEIADSLYRIGFLHLEMQDFEKAKVTLVRAHRMASKLRGENDWLVANCLSALAEVEYELGHFDVALEGAEKAMAIRGLLLDGKDPSIRQSIDLATNLNLLAGTHYQLKDYSKAEAVMSRGLADLKKAIGPDRLGVADLWNTLAMIRLKQKRLDEAATAMQEAARIERKLLGDKSIRLGIRLLNLGIIYRRQGKAGEARASCEEAREMTIEVGGEDHANLPRIERCIQRAGETQA
ncbi:Nephrocystin-3, partial [Exaiptasia diaphana]